MMRLGLERALVLEGMLKASRKTPELNLGGARLVKQVMLTFLFVTWEINV